MRHNKRTFMRTLVATAVVAAFAAPAAAQQVVKIGLLATLEGPFAAGGQDGMRGAELAVKQRNGMVAGKKIEIIKASSDAKPDVAVNATRKLVEQDKVDIMVGPLSGSEGIAVKDYSKTQPNITFINGSSGAQATTPLRCLTASSAPRMPSAPPAANGPSSVASRPILTTCCEYAAPENAARTAAPTSVRTNVRFFI